MATALAPRHPHHPQSPSDHHIWAHLALPSSSCKAASPLLPLPALPAPHFAILCSQPQVPVLHLHVCSLGASDSWLWGPPRHPGPCLLPSGSSAPAPQCRLSYLCFPCDLSAVPGAQFFLEKWGEGQGSPEIAPALWHRPVVGRWVWQICPGLPGDSWGPVFDNKKASQWNKCSFDSCPRPCAFPRLALCSISQGLRAGSTLASLGHPGVPTDSKALACKARGAGLAPPGFSPRPSP